MYQRLHLFQRNKREAESVVLIRNEIGFLRYSAPTVFASETHLFVVDEDIGERSWIDVGRMEITLGITFIERGLCVVECAGRKELTIGIMGHNR